MCKYILLLRVTPAKPFSSELEVLRKEVAVHKEMVGELRKQLHEKEADFQVCVKGGREGRR